MKDQFEMKLDDIIGKPEYSILRVPGGWIYRFWNFQIDDLDSVGTFVPYNEEFYCPSRDTVSDNPKYIAWLKAKKDEQVEPVCSPDLHKIGKENLCPMHGKKEV